MIVGGELMGGVSPQTINVTLTGTTYGVDFRTKMLAGGWDGASPLIGTLTVASGAVVGVMSISSTFPAGSQLALVNNGTISGAGGSGGNGGDGGMFGNPGTPGGPGSTALSVGVPVTITNNGAIQGGGGGGGGAGSTNGNGGEDGGGGGAGCPPGPGGVAGGDGGAGYAGTLTAGGASGCGGYGGGPGLAGAAGQSADNAGGSGGAAGACLTGNSYVTWAATGTRHGPIS